jgi:hypothetical protein
MYIISKLSGSDWKQWREVAIAEELQVLLVKTGDEGHLSAPISFQDLIDGGQTLNVNRHDVESGIEGGVVRVKIDVALQFIFDLLAREMHALPHIRQEFDHLEAEQREGCVKWVENTVRYGEDIGMDNSYYTWLGIRRAAARVNGELFDIDQIAPRHEWMGCW